MAEEDLLTLNVGKLGIALGPLFPAMTSGLGEPDLGTVSEEVSRLGVVLDTLLCLDLSEAISSAGSRIPLFGLDSFSRNLTKASAKLKSIFPPAAAPSDSDPRADPGMMLRR